MLKLSSLTCGINTKKTDLQQIGFNIRRVRTAQCISMVQLAYEIGTSEKQLSRVELGEVNSGIKTYIKIARILNVPFTEFLYKVNLKS